ncbi:MAG: hypothetical protein QOF01_3681 [Thermomicrobiales bacterium]|nr:hypothetical protein [Thermomicrobiales bacterium]
MDGRRFDDISKALAAGTSRRSVLARLVAGVAGGVLGAGSIAAGEAASKRGPGRTCRETANCVAGAKCVKGDRGRKVCSCVDGREACRDQCVDPNTAYLNDPRNCGSCGKRCRSGICCTTDCAETRNPAWTATVTNGGTGAVTASTAVVCGPGTPPLPPGSTELRVGSNGDGAAQLRPAAYNGLKLADLTQLTYSTYVVQDGSGGQAPYLLLNIDLDGDGATVEDLIFFEPVYQDASYFPSNPQASLAVGTWQTWDALNGCWWSVNNVAGAGPGINCKPLSDYLTAQPNSRLATTSAGAFRIVTGFGAGAWDNFVGNVDNVTINGTNYDF